MQMEIEVIAEKNSQEEHKKSMERLMQYWIQLVKPDMPQLADLIIRAKGNDRTMAELAEKVGTSASTLSRAINQKATRPISYEILVKIAENAAEGSEVDLDSLLYADGYRRKRTREIQGDNEIWDKTSRRSDITKLIQEKVLESGAQVSLTKRYTEIEPELDQYYLDYGFPSHGETIIKTDLFVGKKYWVVNPCSYVSEKEDGTDAIDRVSLILKEVSDLLMIDRWRPEQLSNVRFTFAIADELIYYQLLRAFKDLHAKFNNCFTVMLVDLIQKEIVEETVLLHVGGEKLQSWFDVCDMR